MIKSKVFLDTSIISAYFDNREPYRQKLTKQFWHDRLPDLDIFISDIVLTEILNNTEENEKLKKMMLELIDTFTILQLTKEAEELTEEYLKRGIFSVKSIFDANHVAIASVNSITYLVSWNYKHLVKVKTRFEVSSINNANGYNNIQIVTPPEL